MWLNLRTEYSYGAVYGPLKDMFAYFEKHGVGEAGIADINGTWGHRLWEKHCKEKDIKPIYGVRLHVVKDVLLKERRQMFDTMSLIALTNKGLSQIYNLVDLAHSQFYYKPIIGYDQIDSLSPDDVAIIASYSPQLNLLNRHIYLELNPATPYAIRNLKHIDYVACCDNWMIKKSHVEVYQSFAEDRKGENKTSPMHILTNKEWKAIYPDRKDALKNRKKIFKQAKAELSRAPMVRYTSDDDIVVLCKLGAKKRGIKLNKEPYKSRFKREMKLIKSKDYIDYFLIVADLVKFAKKHMVVGHSRGSSAGSLVCYLLEITEIDPIPYGLIFERFIDVNRFDLPDIDIDFQDNKRQLVLKYLQNKYGPENVAQIGNVSRLKPKSAIDRFSKALNIPSWEVDEVKDAIPERSGGDARANMCIVDTFNETEVGESFIKAHPNMMKVADVEAHASHTSVHAAGIIVCNEKITHFCGINSREKGQRIAMIDKKDAEALDLLKIDALGLRTLTILADICDAIGKPYDWLYEIPLTDKKAYKVFKKQRLTGIFQFEGEAVKNLAKQMPVKNILDISALGALGRPGPLATGGATTFTKRRSGEEDVKYISNSKYVVEQTKETYGVIIYQEQVMDIGRTYGGLSWEDVSELRKAMSKSLGDEFFGKYKKKFIEGAVKKGATTKDAEVVWKNMNTMGSWSFNKSHAVSYGMITYLCAYMKAHYPMEFAVASLNHAKTNKDALKLLRDLRENEGIKHIDFDKDNSMKEWSVYKGKLLGGLLNVDGIGPQKANQVLRARKEGSTLPPGLKRTVEDGKTPFKYLYPAKQIYGGFYKNPELYIEAEDDEEIVVLEMKELDANEDVVVIGMLTKKVVRDANEAILVSKRGYKVDGNTTYINLTFEDDTSAVLATIGKDDFDDIGREISESGKVDKDWYLIAGKYDKERNRIYISDIRRITKDV